MDKLLKRILIGLLVVGAVFASLRASIITTTPTPPTIAGIGFKLRPSKHHYQGQQKKTKTKHSSSASSWEERQQRILHPDDKVEEGDEDDDWIATASMMQTTTMTYDDDDDYYKGCYCPCQVDLGTDVLGAGAVMTGVGIWASSTSTLYNENADIMGQLKFDDGNDSYYYSFLCVTDRASEHYMTYYNTNNNDLLCDDECIYNSGSGATLSTYDDDL